MRTTACSTMDPCRRSVYTYPPALGSNTPETPVLKGEERGKAKAAALHLGCLLELPGQYKKCSDAWAAGV